MPEDRVIKIAFIISLAAHCLFLGMPGFNLTKPQPKDPEKISVQIEIEKPSLLPKIDVMGEEKKLKEIEHQSTRAPEHQLEKKEEIIEELQEIEEEPQPEEEKIVEELEQQSEEIVVEEPKPQPEEKIVEELQPEEQIEKEIVEQPQPESPQEIVEVINPQKEVMLRYQDMVKQKIEFCRRYPPWAKKQGIEGTVLLKFIILSNGVCKDIKIVQSSGFNILDKEAISTIERAQPFPPIPPELKASSLPMEVSIVFTLQY